jgi:hypothetical protein
MSTNVKLNALLSLPKDFGDKLTEGESYTIEKDGYRIMPLGIPMELSDHEHKYLAKVVVEEIKSVPGKSFVTFKVFKIFSENESQVFTENFIKVGEA